METGQMIFDLSRKYFDENPFAGMKEGMSAGN